MEFVGKNTNWIVIWDCQRQTYFIYYKRIDNRYVEFAKGYKKSDIECYLG